MDVLHTRLLVSGFGECFRFYDAVLPELTGATLTRGDEGGPYASWDVGAEGVLMLFDRAAMAAVTGTADLPARAPAQDRAMLVSRVGDVDAGFALCVAHGASAVAPPADRPQWGPGMRTAHLRDPDGNLWELQSY
jgi:catechol 2,3-dioxygenase-like lactoylglutathione lyase family enzyme